MTNYNYLLILNNLNKPLVNNQIKADKVRIVDETGKQIGIVLLKEALQIASERGLDLIQVTEKVNPPVCKMGEYGKYLYWLQKKEKRKSQTGGEIKEIRLGFNISVHDMTVKANRAEKFIKKRDKVKIELLLKGRQKSFENLAIEKINNFLEILQKLISIKIERELKKEPKGLTIIISKQTNENT